MGHGEGQHRLAWYCLWLQITYRKARTCSPNTAFQADNGSLSDLTSPDQICVYVSLPRHDAAFGSLEERCEQHQQDKVRAL